MKKITILVLLLVLCIPLSTYSFAADFDDNFMCMNQSDFYDSKEFKDVVKVINDSEIESAYKLHSLSQPDFVSELSKGTNMSDLISSEYVWIASNKSNKSIRIVSENNKWTVAGYSTPTDTDSETNLIKPDQVDLAIESLKAENNAQSPNVVAFEAPMYNTNFVCLTVLGEEHLIPFGSRPDLTGLVNGKLYSTSEVCKILSASSVTNAEDNGGISNSGNAKNPSVPVYQTVLILIAILAIVFVMIFIFKKKYAKH